MRVLRVGRLPASEVLACETYTHGAMSPDYYTRCATYLGMVLCDADGGSLEVAHPELDNHFALGVTQEIVVLPDLGPRMDQETLNLTQGALIIDAIDDAPDAFCLCPPVQWRP